MFLLKPDKDEACTRLLTTRNACPAMSANTSSRKSFTQRDYVRSSTDGVRIDLYSQQDTRMYHYPYAWEAFTLTYALTRARVFSNWKENSRIRYTHGMSCLGWHRSCLSNRYVELFSPSSSLFVDTLVPWPFAVLRAVSRPMTLQSYGQQCALLSPTRYFFFSPAFAWIMRQAWDCHAKPVAREEKQAPRTGRYFHLNARQSATLVYVLG